MLVQCKCSQTQLLLVSLCKSYLPISCPEVAPPSQEGFPNLKGNAANPFPGPAGHFGPCFAESTMNRRERMFTFREAAASLSSFHSQQLPPVPLTGFPPSWRGVSKAAAIRSAGRGGNHILPALHPDSQITPRFSAFSFIFSRQQNVSPLLPVLDGASCRNC